MAETGTERELPYTRHHIAPEDERAVLEALRAERIAQGPICQRFENALARYVGARHAVAVSSGTAALEVALGALGVGPGDRVVVPSLTFVATANAVRANGATPIFADVDATTLNLSAETLDVCMTERISGAIAVHFAGHPAPVDALRQVLGESRFLLEDAAHALGASDHGRSAGSLGDAACFSFHPAKLVTCGEGGAVTTSSGFLARRMRALREHGIERDSREFEGLGLPEPLEEEGCGPWVYEMATRGSNFRLSEPAAALGASQLARADRQIRRRRALVTCYQDALREIPELEAPVEQAGVCSAWHLFPVRVRLEETPIRRAGLYRALHARGIQAQVHYIPVHLQPYYRHRLGTAWGDCPVAEAAYLRLISLPLFPEMSEEDVWRVVDALRAIFREAKS